jgi:hypothetical protein
MQRGAGNERHGCEALLIWNGVLFTTARINDEMR